MHIKTFDWLFGLITDTVEDMQCTLQWEKRRLTLFFFLPLAYTEKVLGTIPLILFKPNLRSVKPNSQSKLMVSILSDQSKEWTVYSIPVNKVSKVHSKSERVLNYEPACLDLCTQNRTELLPCEDGFLLVGTIVCTCLTCTRLVFMYAGFETNETP